MIAPPASHGASHHWALRRLALAALACLLTAAAFAQSPGPSRIEIVAQPITSFDTRDKEQRRFGLLEFRGGLRLSSASRDFGGISSIRLTPDGSRFVAVTDKARWLRGRILYSGSTPTRIVDAETAPMLDSNGGRLSARGWYDTESIAEDGGTLYVGVERVHRIVKFDFSKNGPRARGVPVALPSIIAGLGWNKGFEALVMVPKGLPLAGTLIAVSETPDASGNFKAFLIGGPSAGAFGIARKDEFDASDAAILPSGDMLLLERRSSWLRGIGIRIRRLALRDMRPGAVVDGPAIFSADLNQHIDNMEGLAVHRAPTGETVLTLISDDNFSVLQRTLLLQFTLLEP